MLDASISKLRRSDCRSRQQRSTEARSSCHIMILKRTVIRSEGVSNRGKRQLDNQVRNSRRNQRSTLIMIKIFIVARDCKTWIWKFECLARGRRPVAPDLNLTRIQVGYRPIDCNLSMYTINRHYGQRAEEIIIWCKCRAVVRVVDRWMINHSLAIFCKLAKSLHKIIEICQTASDSDRIRRELVSLLFHKPCGNALWF